LGFSDKKRRFSGLTLSGLKTQKGFIKITIHRRFAVRFSRIVSQKLLPEFHDVAGLAIKHPANGFKRRKPNGLRLPLPSMPIILT